MQPSYFVGSPPWPHQRDAFASCLTFLSSGGTRGYVQMPTGTGKSRLMRALCYAAVQDRRPVVIALPSEEILDQFVQDVRRETRVPFYVDKAERRRPPAALITLASQATLWRRLDLYPSRSLLLFDECHHNNRPARCNRKSLASFEAAIGFSASPWSDECKELFGGRALALYPLSRAVADGFACPYVVEPFPDDVPPPGGQELYFCASNAAALQLAAKVPHSAAVLHDSPNRPDVIQRFRRGLLRRLYLNRCLVEGFDCAPVTRVYIDKESESSLLLYQMAGRALRLSHRGKIARLFCRDVAAVSAALDRAG